MQSLRLEVCSSQASSSSSLYRQGVPVALPAPCIRQTVLETTVEMVWTNSAPRQWLSVTSCKLSSGSGSLPSTASVTGASKAFAVTAWPTDTSDHRQHPRGDAQFEFLLPLRWQHNLKVNRAHFRENELQSSWTAKHLRCLLLQLSPCWLQGQREGLVTKHLFYPCSSVFHPKAAAVGSCSTQPQARKQLVTPQEGSNSLLELQNEDFATRCTRKQQEWDFPRRETSQKPRAAPVQAMPSVARYSPLYLGSKQTGSISSPGQGEHGTSSRVHAGCPRAVKTL